MTNGTEKLFDDNFNPHDKTQILPRGESHFITKTPERAIIKLVKFSEYKPYVLMNYIKHKVGQSDKDTRDHVCLQSLGYKESPERSRYFEARKILKDLKANNGSKAEIAKMESIVTKFRPSTRGWLCVVLPGEAKLKAFRYPQSVIDDIFGVDEKFASDYRPARKGILNEMLEEGRSPFDCRSEVGWIEITKTGTGINTRYHVKEYENSITETQGNKKVTYSEPGKATVNPAILNLTRADIPNVYEFEKKFAFTLEEAIAFTESLGAQVPERFLKKSNPINSVPIADEHSDSVAISAATQADFSQSEEDDVDALPF
ncbi:MAG: hypothetical protein QXL01_07815 [Thermoplasmatales archaeon]